MNKYILELLQLQKTVILPGFGALSVINEQKNEIAFLSYLKHDDGRLATHISQQSNMSVTEAKNAIAKFVREIQLELDKGERYSIFQFGEFQKLDDGEITFVAWKEKDTTEQNTVATEEKKDVPTVLSTSPTSFKEEKPIETKKKTQTIEQKEELARNQEKLEALKTQPEKKKKKVGFWVAAILLCLIIFGATFLAFNFEEYKKHFPFLSEKTENKEDDATTKSSAQEELPQDVKKESEMLDSDSLQNKAEEVEESIAEPSFSSDSIDLNETVQEEILPTEKIDGKNYHIIIGAFASEQNAQRLSEKCKLEGFSSHYFKHKSMYAVSIQSFGTKTEAKEKAKELPTNFSSAWILKKEL